MKRAAIYVRVSTNDQEVGLQETELPVARSLRLLHFDRQDTIFQPRPDREQSCHRPRQSNMAAERADLNHQFVALLE